MHSFDKKYYEETHADVSEICLSEGVARMLEDFHQEVLHPDQNPKQKLVSVSLPKRIREIDEFGDTIRVLPNQLLVGLINKEPFLKTIFIGQIEIAFQLPKPPEGANYYIFVNKEDQLDFELRR
ncbi:hypothetical protein [Shimia sediminis]|uniref:hypothetical protein n=1 Tax=Shimia sediminis TaxID=2497945 RepID=UPI000F8DBCCF|nr:hypothetical protein [Shimia sediminis]